MVFVQVMGGVVMVLSCAAALKANPFGLVYLLTGRQMLLSPAEPPTSSGGLLSLLQRRRSGCRQCEIRSVPPPREEPA
ncbi:MAG TPA: hypothetical protein VIL36_17125 [Acidimicrobiales bacterium]